MKIDGQLYSKKTFCICILKLVCVKIFVLNFYMRLSVNLI